MISRWNTFLILSIEILDSSPFAVCCYPVTIDWSSTNSDLEIPCLDESTAEVLIPAYPEGPSCDEPAPVSARPKIGSVGGVQGMPSCCT